MGQVGGSQASRLHLRIAGISSVFLQIRGRDACIPGSRASRLQAVVLNRQWARFRSQAPFCLPIGKVQAGRPRSVGLACIWGSQAFRQCSFRFAGEMPVSQDRGRLACMRLYSTANERGLDRKRLFVCLSANSRRDARDPLVSPAFEDRRHFVSVPSDLRARRLYPRIAGVSPASGCTQPPMSEI
jgi:hypothetical protein